jgi:hypothetical protein
MRKSNPDNVRTDFATELTALIAYFERVRQAVSGSVHEKADSSRLAESVFVSAYVAFEGFTSNLFIAYLNRDPTLFQQSFDTRIRTSVTEKFSPWHSARVNFSNIRHINVDALREIIDPSQKNMTFRSAAFMKQRAADWLAAPYRNRLHGLTAHDDRLIDTAREIRNYISHRSDSSHQEMNLHLNTIDQGPPNTDLGRGANLVQAVGSFLKSETATGRRVILYIQRILTISAAM